MPARVRCSYCVGLCFVVLCCVLLCFVLFCCVLFCLLVLCFVVLCCVVFCCVLFCFVLFACVLLCCVLLCCVALRFVALRFVAILCGCCFVFCCLGGVVLVVDYGSAVTQPNPTKPSSFVVVCWLSFLSARHSLVPYSESFALPVCLCSVSIHAFYVYLLLGDSGGPLIRKGNSASSDVLVGIVSW